MVAEARPKTGGGGRSEAVRVIVRCRPLSTTEISQGHQSIVTCYSERGVIELKNPSLPNNPSKDFTFDAVYNESSKQMDLYDETFRDLVDSVLNGFNGTIFAYGQTGTGKTYTMEGVSSDRGVIFNCFQHIFDHIAKSKNQQYLVRASYMEIYKEEIRDLLSKDPNMRLELKERPDAGVYVKDLSSFLTKSVEEIHGVMAVGNANRSVGRTNMNEHSSRSHAIFTITVECSDLDAEGECHIRVGKLNLVDLAGSERQAKTGATGERFKEATKINLSLSALGNVISALVDGKSTHVPYRDSKLTRLLQDSLGGNSKTVMVACVGPASYNYEETSGTLRYANRAKNIKNKPRINEDPKDALLREFQEEIIRLRTMLEQRKGKKDTDKGEDYYKKTRKSLEADKQKIMRDETLVAEERARLMASIEERQKQLEGERKNQARVLKKIQDMESKLLGGVDLVDQTRQQQMELERRRIELAEQKKREREVQQQLEKQEDDTAEIHQTFADMQQEVEVTSKKLSKLKLKLRKIRIELNDTAMMHSQERRELERDVSEINKELKLKLLIVDNFVPSALREKIKERATWSEDDSQWNLPGARPLSADKPVTTENILLGGDDQAVLTRSIGADSGVSFSEPGTSKAEIFEKRPISNPGLRRPVSSYERDIVARARRQLSRMPKPPLVGHQPVQPILNEDILRFCGENVLIFSGLERFPSNVKDYDPSGVILSEQCSEGKGYHNRRHADLLDEVAAPFPVRRQHPLPLKKRARPQRAWLHDKPVYKSLSESKRSRREVRKPSPQPHTSLSLPTSFIPHTPPLLLDPVTAFRNAIIPIFSCASSETSESEGICADYLSRGRQSDFSTDEDLWSDRMSSRFPCIQNLDHSVDLGEYLLFERRTFSVPRSPMDSSMLNSSYQSPRSSRIPVSNKMMSQSFSVSSSLYTTPNRITRATQSLTEAMDGSKEQLCEPLSGIKDEVKKSLARSRARSLQKPRLDDRWLLEPGDMSRSLSASYRLPSPSNRVLNRPQICRTADEIHAERSILWLSKLRSEIESFVDEKGRLSPDSDINDDTTLSEPSKKTVRKWKKRNAYGGFLPLSMEKLIRWFRATHSYCQKCRDTGRLQKLVRESGKCRLRCPKIEKSGVVRRSRCTCEKSLVFSVPNNSLNSTHLFDCAVFFAALAFFFRMMLIFF